MPPDAPMGDETPRGFVKMFRESYSNSVQLSRYQAQAIGAAILSRSPGCRLLVFGLGHDTGLWLRLNATGMTHFLETSAEWMAIVGARHADISCGIMPDFGITVRTSMALTDEQLARCVIPDDIRYVEWDVILVDAPPGYEPQLPGRAVAIYWASRMADRRTHVFVDDYDRPLEAAFADRFLRTREGSCSTVIQASEQVADRKLFWSMGDPL